MVIFAGNGDGTFQATPFYTVPLPQQTQVETASVGDVKVMAIQTSSSCIQACRQLPVLKFQSSSEMGKVTLR